MPQVIAGTASDLTKTVAKLTKELLEANWPTTGFDPVKSKIKFGLGTWDKSGDYQVHVNTEPADSRPILLGGSMTEIMDPVSIRVFVRKNSRSVPDQVGAMQRKIEEICKDNQGSLGQGIPIFNFNGWGAVFESDNLKDVWQQEAKAMAIYWRVRV